MKKGDLVRISPEFTRQRVFGIVVESGKYAGNRDVKVMWPDIGITTEKSSTMEIVSD
jgi:hypothetical protein